MNNHGNYIISLGNLCRWLAQQAESLGVEVYAGFAAAEILYDAQDKGGAVLGVATGDVGIAKDGSHKPEYQPGMELRAKYTLFAEGCRGSLSQELMSRFNLRDGIDPQKYGIGLKELWQVTPDKHRPGLVLHSQGWPLDSKTGGGSFMYHFEDQLVAVGFVVHLNYENPHLSPYDEFQRFKTHAADTRHVRRREAAVVRRAGNQRRRPAIGPAARISRRCADRLRRGLLNVPRIKGTHNGNEDRDAGRGGRVRGLARGASTRRIDRVSGDVQAVLGP